jgi:hypothetical protein
MKLQIPNYAKVAARAGLEIRSNLPASRQFGLDRAQAEEAGVASGVERAKEIIKKDFYDWDNEYDREALKKMRNFYNRFKNCRTFKCEGAHLI